MKFYFVIISLWLSGSVYAQKLKFTQGAKNELIITGPDCPTLIKSHQGLCAWKRLIEPSFTLTSERERLLEKDCKKISAKSARMTVVTCLPTFAREHHGKKLYVEGPNCWGTAMGFKALSPKPRFMWSEEMIYWMESPLCRKLSVGESLRPGDIINVYGPEYMDEKERLERDEGTRFTEALYPGRFRQATEHQGNYTGYHRLLHSETYVSPDMTFGKLSPNKLDRFEFHPLEEVYGRPRDTEKECQENQNLSPYLREYNNPPKNIRGSKCAYFTTAHRCENFNDYFTKLNFNPEMQEIWKNVQALQGLQEKLFSLVITPGMKLENCEVTLLVALADITLKRVEEQMRKGPKNKEHEMLLSMEYFAAAAIRQSLKFAGLIP